MGKLASHASYMVHLSQSCSCGLDNNEQLFWLSTCVLSTLYVLGGLRRLCEATSLTVGCQSLEFQVRMEAQRVPT